MTPPTCAVHCNGLGYRFMGLDNGVNCYCGREYGKHGTAADSDCDQSPCTGDGSPKCGGSYRTAAYRIHPDGDFREISAKDSMLAGGQDIGRVVTATPMAVQTKLECAGYCLTSAPCWGLVWITGQVQNCVLISAHSSPEPYTIHAAGRYYHI
ncbi:PREDICTED: putative fungistatic metabolite [Priapulus caudatus]|uniref:Fungistatic metabolite n=1 Tax=Priapulus caudatus TaxID=37621 RepID=A0ABM1E1J3_PRICU|nr:PREDICTED: putative fungistatic metabolite [Priapulus caudatus]